jgi:hypothetical protein
MQGVWSRPLQLLFQEILTQSRISRVCFEAHEKTAEKEFSGFCRLFGEEFLFSFNPEDQS